jgi:hypothetical protein
MRSLDAGTRIDEDRQAYRDLVRFFATWKAASAKGRREAVKQLEHLKAPRAARGRPPKHEPEHYSEVARIYEESRAMNRTTRRAVAQYFDVSDAVADHWIRKARALGLIERKAPKPGADRRKRK